MAIDDQMRQERAAGCLAGVAIGDALGEPGGFVTSDDTAQTIILAQSLIAHCDLDADDLASRLAAWYRDDGYGIGRHTQQVLSRVAAGENWESAAIAVQTASPDSAGNGSLMRCAPVALLPNASRRRLIEQSRLSSRVTHMHPLCQWSCAFLDSVIADLLEGEAPDAAVNSALILFSSIDEFPGAILEQAEGADSSAARSGLNPSGYVLDSLKCSLWALLHHASFEETLRAAVELGGDSDTIGAITGSLAGAAFGIKSIPSRWVLSHKDVKLLQNLALELLNSC